MPIEFRGIILKGTAEPDLLIDEHIVVEVRAVEEFHRVHSARLLTCLRVTRRPLGFLNNFNAPTLSEGIRRLLLTSS